MMLLMMAWWFERLPCVQVLATLVAGSVEPAPGARVLVNGEVVTRPRRLRPGDRLVVRPREDGEDDACEDRLGEARI